MDPLGLGCLGFRGLGFRVKFRVYNYMNVVGWAVSHGAA